MDNEGQGVHNYRFLNRIRGSKFRYALDTNPAVKVLAVIIVSILLLTLIDVVTYNVNKERYINEYAREIDTMLHDEEFIKSYYRDKISFEAHKDQWEKVGAVADKVDAFGFPIGATAVHYEFTVDEDVSILDMSELISRYNGLNFIKNNKMQDLLYNREFGVYTIPNDYSNTSDFEVLSTSKLGRDGQTGYIYLGEKFSNYKVRDFYRLVYREEQEKAIDYYNKQQESNQQESSQDETNSTEIIQ